VKTTTDAAKATEMLHTIETAIIEKMARSTGYAAFGSGSEMV